MTIATTATVTELPKKKGETSGPYRVGGSFALLSVVVAPSNRPDKDKPMSLLSSWLPLSNTKFDPSGPAGYRHPGVIPALNATSLKNVKPALDAYAAERGWDLQASTFYYRPKALVDLIGEDGLVRSLPVLMRNQTAKERIFINVPSPSEGMDLMQPLLDVCAKVLEEGGFKLRSYFDANNPRSVLTAALIEYPFLVHHIFKAFPNLHVLRHSARVIDRIEVINHIRYRKSEAHGLNATRNFSKELIKVAL